MSSEPVNLSIVIVNWNSEEYLSECIPSICEWTREVSFEVIVVDNASPSGGIDRLAASFPTLKVIRSDKNLGFSRANNLGFQHASGDCVLFLNPDTKLISPAIDAMMRELKSLPDAGVVGCRLLNADLSVQTSSIMNFPRIWNTILMFEYLRLRWPRLWGIGPLVSEESKPVEVEAISGACMLMKREVFEKIGMFSEDYFMYSEDVDLCYQATRAGFKNYHVGQGQIVHYGGRSSAPAWQVVMKTSAELRFAERNYGRTYRTLFRLALILNASARLTLTSLASAFRNTAGYGDGLNSLRDKTIKWSAILKTLLRPRKPCSPPVTTAGMNSA